MNTIDVRAVIAARDALVSAEQFASKNFGASESGNVLAVCVIARAQLDRTIERMFLQLEVTGVEHV